MDFDAATKLLSDMSTEYAAQLGRLCPNLEIKQLEKILFAHALAQTMVVLDEDYGNRLVVAWPQKNGLREFLVGIYQRYRAN